jgi:hypothetical protein
VVITPRDVFDRKAVAGLAAVTGEVAGVAGGVGDVGVGDPDRALVAGAGWPDRGLPPREESGCH